MLRLNSLQLIYPMLVHTICISSRKDYYEVQLIKETKSWDHLREIYQIMNGKLEEYCHSVIILSWTMLPKRT